MILITGSAKNLGRAIAIHLAEKKHDLVLHYRNSLKEVEKVARECKRKGVQAEMIQGDFSTQEGTSDFIERYLKKGLPTKGLINNVGEYFVGSLQKTTSETWRGLFESNLHAPFALSTALLPFLEKERGRIVNIGTPNLKTLHANLYSPAYKATKLSLAYLTTCLAKEVASKGVTVNMVSPGYLENSVDSPMNFPMGRPAKFDEVAAIVSFFFEKESEYITGQNIEVAGGIGL